MPIAGLAITAAASAYAANRQASAAKNAAKRQTYTPYNVNMNGVGSANYDGTNLTLTGDPTQQAMANGLLGMGQQGIGQYAQGNGQYNQNYLTGAFDQSNQYQNLDPSVMGGAANYFGAGQAALGQLGSFDPNAAASQYTNNLRATALPQEQQAAANMADQLFAGGRLGTTGGQGLFGQLINQQSQADIQRQIAGQQYGQQSQMNLAGLAQNLGNTGYGMMSDINNNQYNRVQDRFSRAMQTFGGAQGYGQQNFQNSLGLLNAGNQMQQQQFGNLMQMGQQGANTGAMASGQNTIAANTQLAGQQNQIAGLLGGFNGMMGQIPWGSFGGGTSTGGYTPATTASADQYYSSGWK